MRIGLYQKIFFWLLLNLVLIGLLASALVIGVLFKGSNGLLPTYLFSSNAENAFRTISAHCQYKPVCQWTSILQQYAKDDKLYFAVCSLEDVFSLPGTAEIPPAMVHAAAAMPKFPFTLCPDPSIVLPGRDIADDSQGLAEPPKMDTPSIDTRFFDVHYGI